MQDPTLSTPIAVLAEIPDAGLWSVMVAAMRMTHRVFHAAVRGTGIGAACRLRVRLHAPFARSGALRFVETMTRSGFRENGGPRDLLAMIGIAGTEGPVSLADPVPAVVPGGRQRS